MVARSVDLGPQRPVGSAASVRRGSTLNIAGAVCNQASLFAITFYLARSLGRADVGGYAIAYAAATILGYFVLAGFQATATRFVSMRAADADVGRLRGVLRLAFRTTTTLSTCVAVPLLVLAEPVARLFHGALDATDVRLVALTVVAGCVRDTALAATQGWQTQRPYAVIALIIEPLLRLALTVGLAVAGFGLTGAVTALAGGSCVAALLACLALRRRVRPLERTKPVLDTAAVLRFSAAAWGTTLATVGLVWADTLLLGGLGAAREVGVYTVATRLVNLAVFAVAPLNSALSPHFARLLHLEDRSGLRTSFTSATVWLCRLTFPAFVVLAVLPADLLGLFGPGFRAGADVTLLLAGGQLVNVLTGPAGTVLNMSDRVRLNSVDAVVVLLLNIGLNLWLIPVLGIVGAAIAWSAPLALVNVVRLVQVRSLVGAFPLDLRVARAAVAAVLSGVSCLLVSIAVPDFTGRALVATATAVAAYTAFMLWFGLGSQDRAMLRSVASRRGGGRSAGPRAE